MGCNVNPPPQAEQLIKDFQTRVSQRNTPRKSAMKVLERGLSVVDGSNTPPTTDTGSGESSVVESTKERENDKGISQCVVRKERELGPGEWRESGGGEWRESGGRVEGEWRESGGRVGNCGYI